LYFSTYTIVLEYCAI